MRIYKKEHHDYSLKRDKEQPSRSYKKGSLCYLAILKYINQAFYSRKNYKEEARVCGELQKSLHPSCCFASGCKKEFRELPITKEHSP